MKQVTLDRLKKLQAMLQSEETTVAIVSQETGVNKTTINNIKNGTAKVEKIYDQTALVLSQWAAAPRSSSSEYRDYLFGRIWELLSYHLHTKMDFVDKVGLGNLKKRPASTIDKIASTATKSGWLVGELLELFTREVAKFNPEDFNDQKLGSMYWIGRTSMFAELREKEKSKD